MKHSLKAQALWLAVLLVLCSGAAFAADMRVLIDRDCSKCHRQPVADLTTRGGAHTTQLQCRDCHAVHPRYREKIPVDCSSCHSLKDLPHYALADCAGCHHGHHPLDVNFSKIKTSPLKVCQSCHEVQARPASSPHAALGCGECHGEHRTKPDCLNCHSSHDESTIKGGDCTLCHPAHNPSPPVMTEKVAPRFCAACHPDQATAFSASGGAHLRKLGCSGCHQKHAPGQQSLPLCSQCHAPSASPHFSVGNCRNCHSPHAPATGDLSALSAVRGVCATCHAKADQALGKGGVSHGGQDCNSCHQRHGKSPSCLDCHEGHSEGMSAAACRSCHAPHKPLPPSLKGFIDARLCGNCHKEQAETFLRAGKAHKTELGCNGCHTTHPPEQAPLPDCLNCHSKDAAPHFAIGECLRCHNPHAPVVEELADLNQIAAACASCHEEPSKRLQETRNPHGAMQCNECHARHGKSPDCRQCHEPHAQSMQQADCLRCHNPHSPLAIHPEQGIAPQLCAACHSEQAGQIIKGGGAHRDKLNCAACHRTHPEAGCDGCHEEHPSQSENTPPRCNACHTPTARPHFASGGCRDCHSPHHPRDIDLSKRSPALRVCLGCHPQVGEMQAGHPEKHSSLDCLECHPRHGEKRQCNECHKPHGPSLTTKDCLVCHKAHAPAEVRFGADTPAELCAPCHTEEARTLAARPSGHRDQAGCVTCHPLHPQKGRKPPRPGMEEHWAADCSKCHNRLLKRHYTANECLSCHSPHDPQNVRVGAIKDAREGCSSCHYQEGRLGRLFPSRHTGFDCRKCHAGHKGKMRCVECHQPHASGMAADSCAGCHPAHYPKIIEFGKEVSPKDCQGCHTQQTALLEAKGAGHKKVNCTGCHKGHPPRGKDVIPECVDCHRPGRNKHFRIQGCALCHSAHAPGELDFVRPGVAAPACASCHGAQFKEMASNPSAHSRLDCSACHPNHGRAKTCLECHSPHSGQMIQQNCTECHRPHKPLEVLLDKGLDGKLCSACHQDQSRSLGNSRARHNRLNCVDCHFGRHGEKLGCETCHVPPHEAGLHNRYPDCLSCHIDPHDLAVKKPAATAAPKPQPSEPPAAASAAGGETESAAEKK